MSKLYQDNMAMVRKFRRPDLFITFTYNPKWKEIKSELQSFQTPSDRPDLVNRVFRFKIKDFIDDIVKRKIFGEILVCAPYRASKMWASSRSLFIYTLQ